MNLNHKNFSLKEKNILRFRLNHLVLSQKVKKGKIKINLKKSNQFEKVILFF